VTTEIRFRVALDGGQQVQAGAQAAAQGLSQLAQASGAAQRQVGVTGQQTAQLSNQLQDLFIQIQAGGNPLTAFLQQGSQLSAVFGGAGNALRAVVGLVTPAVAAFAGVAAAVGTVAYAFLQGDKERLAFARGIVLTGNAAGVTASQLNEMAKAASSFGASRGQGASVLAQLVASGQVAAGVLGQATEAAIRLERDGGVAIDKTVQAFTELGKTPLETLRKLNEAQNFLSVGAYKQIASLVDQGKAAEAAALAQKVYASEQIERGKQLEASLGDVEKAWRGITQSIKGAVDAILEFGRQDKPADSLARTQTRIEQLRGRLQYGRIGASNITDTVASDDDIRKELDAQTQLAIKLQEGIATQGKLAAATAASADARAKGIKAIDDERDAAKKAAKEFEGLAKAGQDLVRAFAFEDAGSATDIVEKWQQIAAARKAGLITLEQQIAAQQRLAQQQPFAERELKSIQDLARARADARTAEDKGIQDYLDQQQKARDASLKGAQDSILKLQEENAAAELMRGTNLSLAEAIEQVSIARLREQKASYTEGSEPYIAVEREIEARQRLLGLLGEKSARDANAKAAKDAADDWQRTTDDIRNSLTNAFRDSFRDGEDFGAAFAKNLGAELKARLATAVAEGLAGLVLQAVGLNVSGAVGAAGQGSAYLQAAQAANTLYGYGKSAYGYVSGLASTGSTLGASTGAYTSMANSQALAAYGVEGAGAAAGGVTGAAGSGASSGVALSTWAAAIALGVYKANQDYSAGFRRDQARDVGRETGGASGSFEFAQATILSKLGVSDRWADLLSGATAVAALIGRAAPRVEGVGVQGTISGGDFTGSAFADVVEKGGLFRSDKRYTETSALSEELGRYLDGASRGILDKAKDFGAALGLPVDALANVSQQIKVALTDDAAKNQAAITEALGGYGDLLVAGFAEAIRPLAGYIDGVAETTAQTLARVGASITGVNDVLDALGLSALKASIDGGRAATELEALFGGLGTLQQAAGSYLQAYYSDAERAALATKGIGQALGEFGLQVPATREAFRALVDAQDLTSASGREAFAALMGVADAFAAVTPEASAAAGKLKSFADLQSAVDANIVKFLNPAQATDYQYGTIARDLQSAGLAGASADLGAALKAATKDDIFAFASQFVALEGTSNDAKIAIVEAAGALADLKDAAGATADEFAKRITQFTAGLRSSDLSPLSYQEQLNTARGLYDRTLSGAQAGDPTARENLLGNAQAYLQEARSFFGSSSDYADAFRRVTTELDAMGAPSADPQLQAIREQVTQLEAMRSSVVDLSTTSSTKADAQADLARAQIAELQNVVQAQGDTNSALAVGHRALWDQLEALNARVQRLLDNAQLEAAEP
jgi:phage-related minor tail protein